MRTLAALAVGALAVLAPLSAAGGAKGTFSYEGRTLKIVDGFAYEGPEELGDGTAVRVRLLGAPLDRSALDGVLDYAHAVQKQTAGPYVEMEFSMAGRWSGSSYSLGGSTSCGWCADGRAGAKSQMKVEGGAIRGTLKVVPADYMDGKGPAVDLTLDLPVATVNGATPLPAGGGEAGKALAACRAAFAKKLKTEVLSRCFAADDPDLPDPENVTDDGFWMIAGMGHDALRMGTLKVTGGRVRGDWAELMVEGKGEDGPSKGSVFLRKTSAGWRIDHERLTGVY